MINKKVIFVFVGIMLILSFGLSLANARLFADPAQSSVPITSLKKGLVGHWVLDSINYNSNTVRVTDKSAYSNHGTTVGPVLTTGRQGGSNDAMSFDGSNDYITVPNSDSLNTAFGSTETFSISTWIKPTSWVSYGAVSKAPGGCWSHSTNSLWIYASGFRCVMGDGNTAHCNSGGSYIGTGSYQPALNEWYNVACTSDGTTLRMYVNGVQRGTASVSSITLSRLDNTNPLIIGRRTAGSGGAIAGSVGDVRVYDRALSLLEINKLYYSHKSKVSLGSTQKGLILDMPLTSSYTKSETVGSEIITDKTPNSYDGTNGGSTLSSTGASFDGNDYIDLPNSVGYTNAFSAFAWFKSTGSPPGGYHIIFGGQELEISIPSSTGQIRTGIYTNARHVSNHGSGLVDGNWHLVGVTFEGTNKSSWIDGKYVGDDVTSGTLTSSFSNRKIGRYGSSTSYYANGQISGVKIYNRVLSTDEIETLYARGIY